jgi:hypothetical protein
MPNPFLVPDALTAPASAQASEAAARRRWITVYQLAAAAINKQDRAIRSFGYQDLSFEQLIEAVAREAVVAATGVEPSESSRRGDRGWGVIAMLVYPAVYGLAFELLHSIERSIIDAVADAAGQAHQEAVAAGLEEDEAEDAAREAAEEAAYRLGCEHFESIVARLIELAKKNTRDVCRDAWRRPLPTVPAASGVERPFASATVSSPAARDKTARAGTAHTRTRSARPTRA